MSLWWRLSGRRVEPKPPARGRWFKLQGVPFYVLMFEERDSVLSEFESLLAQAQSGLVLARRSSGILEYKGYSLGYTEMLFYAYSTRGNPVKAFNAIESEPPRRPRALGVRGRSVILEDGSYARVYVAYRFPSGIPEGLPSMVLGLADEVVLYFELIPRHRAVGMADSIRRRRSGVTGVVEDASVGLG